MGRVLDGMNLYKPSILIRKEPIAIKKVNILKEWYDSKCLDKNVTLFRSKYP